jgi:hypothetical protein
MVIVLVTVSALLAALSNATASVLQRLVTGQPDPKKLFKLNFVGELFTHKLWLAGGVLDALGFVLQAVALWKGSLVLVEPLMTVDLVFLMLILRFRYKVTTGTREWLAVAGIVLGLSGLLIAADPRSRMNPFDGTHWLIISIISTVVILSGVFVVRNLRSSNLRAAIAGTITGVNFAFSASLTKLAVQQLQYGLPYFLSHWQFYAMVASLLVSMVNIQSAYAAGSLAISQPALEIVNPVVSVLFGIYLFGDFIRLTPLAIAGEVVSAVAVAIGVILLTDSRSLLHSRL